MKNKQKFFLFVLVVIVTFSVFLIKPLKQTTPSINNDIPKVVTVSPSTNYLIDQFEYSGKNGIDALTLLKQKTSVELATSGIVISISGREVDSNQHEFWSFYINGEPAQVGPASYITKDNDIINWKIEKY
jgi:hypothetical protein